MEIPVKMAGFAALFVSLSLCAISAQARNTRYLLPINEVVKTGRDNGKLGGDVRLYFGRQSHPPVRAMLVKGVVTNKKTNKLNRTDKAACRRVMLSAMAQLQDRARREGGNAVINIRSYYKKRSFISESQYECRAGATVSAVALRGDIVRLGR